MSDTHNADWKQLAYSCSTKGELRNKGLSKRALTSNLRTTLSACLAAICLFCSFLGCSKGFSSNTEIEILPDGSIKILAPKNNRLRRYETKLQPEAWFSDPKTLDLCRAIVKQDVDEMQRLIDDGANVNAKGKDGMPLLLWAYSVGEKVVERLLENGAEPNFIFETDYRLLCAYKGFSFLTYAIEDYGRPEHEHTVDLLLKYGANPNLGSLQPLVAACVFYRSDETIFSLVEADADLHPFDKYGEPISYVPSCLGRRRFGVALYLLRHGADYDINTRQGAEIQNTLYSMTVKRPEELRASEEELQQLQILIDWLKDRGVTFDAPAPSPIIEQKKFAQLKERLRVHTPRFQTPTEYASPQTRLEQDKLAPEFIADNDDPTTISRNEDRYVKLIDANGRSLTPSYLPGEDKIHAVVPEGRQCQYAFCDDSGYACGCSSLMAPLLSINPYNGEICPMRAMTAEEIASPPSFTIVAYDRFAPERYDFATLELLPFFIDLHIDDGNSYSDPDGHPALPNKYSVSGKVPTSGVVVKPNWGDQDGDGDLDCWEGYSIDGNANTDAYLGGKFYPVVVEIPDGIPLSKIRLNFTYRMASLKPSNKNGKPGNGENSPNLSNGFHFHDGAIRLWKKDGSYPRDGRSAKDGGDLIHPTDHSDYYSPEQIGFTETDRKIVLYLEAVTENIEKNREAVERMGLPNMKLAVTVKAYKQQFEAQVAYVVSNDISTYSELLPRR